MKRTIQLFGMTIDALDIDHAVETIWRWCQKPRDGRCRYVVTPNVDHVVMYQSNPLLRTAYSGASLVLADGMPVVLASRLLRQALPQRVAGSDLVPALLDRAAGESRHEILRVFLLGAASGVAGRAASRIHQRWSGVEVVGKEKLGGGYVTVIVKGDVAAVKAAIDAGQAKVGDLGKLIASHVIAHPSPGVLSLLPGK